MPTVTINCAIPNGVTLRRFAQRQGLLGISEAVFAGSVTLKRGFNPGIDLEFWDAWLAQNTDNSIVTSGSISIAKES
jgi:hypothetical protein